MDRILASVRGYIQVPCLLEIDPETRCLSRVTQIEWDSCKSVPLMKRGFTELQYSDGGDYLIAATWDRICLLDPVTYEVRDIITDRRFSDIHGLHVDVEGVIWIANTNLDGVYTIRNGKVEAFWHAWDSEDPRLPRLDEINDYRTLSKHEIPFHDLHLNGVLATPDYVFVCYLGPGVEMSWLRKKLVSLGVLRERTRDGGVLVIDRQTRQVVRRFRLDGLHNCVPDKQGQLHFAEYYSNSLVVLDLERLTIRRNHLRVPSYREWGYLTRGILPTEDGYWIGHTAVRGWRDEHPKALVRFYLKDGEWNGWEIELPGYAGIYDLIQKR
jgi:hypothetical protein